MDAPNGYCSQCGTATIKKQIEDRLRSYCPECETPQYKNPKPCAGLLVVDDDAVLLVQRTQPPSVGQWSVPAGYLEFDEPPELGAARELTEETGLEVDPDVIELFDTAFVPHDDGTYVLVVIYAVSRTHTEGSPRAGSDAGDIAFWSHADLANAEALEPGFQDIFRRAIVEYGETPFSR